MEETFAGLVAEAEKAVRPLGFRIESAEKTDRTPLMMKVDGISERLDDNELKIVIVRKCNSKRFDWVGLSDTQNNEEEKTAAISMDGVSEVFNG